MQTFCPHHSVALQSASELHCTQTIRVLEQCVARRERMQSMSDMQPAAQRCVTESQTGAAPMPVLMQSLDCVHWTQLWVVVSQCGASRPQFASPMHATQVPALQ